MDDADGNNKVSLKELVDTKLRAVEENVNTKIQAIEKATVLAADILKERLEHMNRFREEIERIQNTFLTKETYEDKHNRMMQMVDELRIAGAKIEGKASQKDVNRSNIFALVSLIIAILAVIVSIIVKII